MLSSEKIFLTILSPDKGYITDKKNLVIEIHASNQESKRIVSKIKKARKERNNLPCFIIQDKFEKELEDFGMFILDITYKDDVGNKHHLQKIFKKSDFIDERFDNKIKRFKNDNFYLAKSTEKDYPYHFVAELKKSEINIMGEIRDREKSGKLKTTNTKIKWSRSTKEQIIFLNGYDFKKEKFKFSFKSAFDGIINTEPYILIIKPSYKIKFHRLNKKDHGGEKASRHIIKLEKRNSNTKIEMDCPQTQKYSQDCGKCVCENDDEVYYPIHDICGPDCAEDELPVYNNFKYTCEERTSMQLDGIGGVDNLPGFMNFTQENPCLTKIKTTLNSIKKCDLQDIEQRIYETFFCNELCSQFIENTSQRISLLQVATIYALEIKSQYDEERFKKELDYRKNNKKPQKTNLTDIERVLFLYSFIDSSTNFSDLYNTSRGVVLDYYKNKALFYEWYIHSFFFLYFQDTYEPWYVHYPNHDGIFFHNELKYTVCDEGIENRLGDDEMEAIGLFESKYVGESFYRQIIKDSKKCWEEYQRYSKMLEDFKTVDRFIDIRDKKEFLRLLSLEVLGNG